VALVVGARVGDLGQGFEQRFLRHTRRNGRSQDKLKDPGEVRELAKRIRPKKILSEAEAERIRNNKVSFFIPDQPSPEEAEREYALFCNNARAPADQRRIRAIRYVNSHQDEYFEEVGVETTSPREKVIAILSKDDYWLVCTPTRGCYVGTCPITIGTGEMLEVHYFDGGFERFRFP
jgi:hypothetical protein